MNASKLMIAIFLSLTLVGCANLKEVREFAGESAKLSAYTELTNRFRDTYAREEPYLIGQAARIAKENDEKRQTAHKDLLKIHQAATSYMQTLAILAGDESFDLSKSIDSLGNGIKSYPDLGIDKTHVDAVSNIAKIIARWITSKHQERAVRDMIKEGDAPLQTTLDGMIKLVRYYRKTNENEQKSVLGFFEVEIPYLDSSKDKLLASLARVHVKSKKAEYAAFQKKYDNAEKGIKGVAEGHKKLLEDIDNLSKDSVKDAIKKISKDIKSIRENLQTIRN